MPTPEDLENWFMYHAPSEVQIAKYAVLREKAKEFAYAILQNCPPSADQTAALRRLREAVMTANASIACFQDPVDPAQRDFTGE